MPADAGPSDALRRLNAVDKLSVTGHINACVEELRAVSARVMASSTECHDQGLDIYRPLCCSRGSTSAGRRLGGGRTHPQHGSS